MKLLRTLHSSAVKKIARHGCALTIGNFDAVHIGHREILRALVAQAKRRNLASGVMTFDPHPQEFFHAAAQNRHANRHAPPRLTDIAARYFALRECGVDFMLSVKFNNALANTAADEFVRRTLADDLGVKFLLVGDDFRFGAKRAGDFKLLEAMAGQCGFEVARCDAIKHDLRRVSSTWIRELLASGDCQTAARLLGRNYAICGRVIHGDKRGREWGFPTVNLPIRRQVAVRGIFAVRVLGLGAPLDGVASLGKRPTLRENNLPTLCEVHLFDFAGEIYGKRICVEFIAKIRDEEKFDDYDTLIQRIADDAKRARAILRRMP